MSRLRGVLAALWEGCLLLGDCWLWNMLPTRAGRCPGCNRELLEPGSGVCPDCRVTPA